MKDVNEMIASGELKNVISGTSSDNYIQFVIKHPEEPRVITFTRLAEMAITGYATSDEVQLLANAILSMRRY